MFGFLPKSIQDWLPHEWVPDPNGLGICDEGSRPHFKSKTCVNWRPAPKPWRFTPFGEESEESS